MWRKFVHPSSQPTDERNVRTGREKRAVQRVSPKKVSSGVMANSDGTRPRVKKSEDKTDELEVGQTMASEDGAEERRAKVGSRVYKSRCEAEASTLLHKSYHGLMPRDEIEDMLVKDGDFLVRLTELDNAHRLAVSVRWGGRAKHILFKLNKSLRWIVRSDAPFDSVAQLISFYVSSKAELQAEGTKLLNPIKRPAWYILHEHINLGKKLGSGSFGDVFLAQLLVDGKKVDVAAKTLKGKMGKQERSNFVKEASINRRLVHPNVVRMLGVASQTEPIIVVLQLAPGGSLKSHCREHAAELTKDQLIKFLVDAARGLKYLASKNVIHRDIAARNCLLSANLTVKISDFGLSVTTVELREQKLQKVPVRYLAPETLRSGIFSTKSDVWSFGVMMWELFTFCKSDPYPGLSNSEVKAMVLGGKHMDPPANTPPLVSTLMLRCWLLNPEERPPFVELLRQLSPNGVVEEPTVITEEA